MATDALLDSSDGFDDDLDDDYVFDPSAWDIAFRIGVGADPDTDPGDLDELIDALLVHAEGPLLERLTDEAVGRVWDDELAGLVRAGLVKLSQQVDEWGPAASAALVEFDRAPAQAEVSREVVISLAMELGQGDHPVFFCLCCIDEVLSRHDPAERRALARRAAILARRNAAVPAAEIQAALAGVGATPPAVRLATDARRRAVRARLGRLAEFGRNSMPPLAAELRSLADEPLPVRPEDDDVWEEVCTLLLANLARPELN